MVRARDERPNFNGPNFRRNAPHPARPAGTGPRGQDRGGAPPGRAHQAAGLARPARGDRRMAGRLAGPRQPAGRAAARRGVRRHPRRGGARRFGLPDRSHRADGEELPGRRRRHQPARRGDRRRSPHLRARPRPSDGRLHARPGDERDAHGQRHGLRHDGGRARHRRAVPGRDGHRQHHDGGHALRRRCSAAAAPTGRGPAPA